MQELILKNVDENMIQYIESIVEENKCKIIREEWRSKYNNYVVYDYKPFCSDGFELSYFISGASLEHLHFVEWLYNNKAKEVQELNHLLTV